MFFGNVYKNGYLYWFVVRNLTNENAAEDQKQCELSAWINHNWSVHVNR